MKKKKFKYEWDRTWEGRESDYVARDGQIRFGRVQLHTSGPAKVWTWHFWGDAFAGIAPSANGSDPDKDEACRQLEAAYDAAKASVGRQSALDDERRDGGEKHAADDP
jgi:hypothetical protein